MTEETGTDTEGGELRAVDRALPAVAVRHRRHDRHRHLHRAHAAVPVAGPAVDPVVRVRRRRRRPHRDLLRRAGQRRAGLGLVVLVRLRHAGRGRRDGRRGVPAARVRRRRPPPSRSAGRSTSTSCSTTCSASRSRTSLANAPEQDGVINAARRDPGRALRAAADPRRERVGEGQRDDGADQARRAGAVHRRSASPAGTPTTSPTSPRSASPGSARPPASSSSPTSAWTPCRPPARRSTTRGATLPLAILIALITVTTLYLARRDRRRRRAAVADFEGQEAGLSAILEKVTGDDWPATVLAAGAVISIFSVTLVVHLRPDADPVRDGPRRDDPAAVPPAEPAHADAGAGDDHRARRRSRCSPGCCRSTSSPR